MPRGVRRAVTEEGEGMVLEQEAPSMVKVAGSLTVPNLSTEDIRAREQANKLFPYLPYPKAGWIDMTIDEAHKYEKQGLLKGFDPNERKGLLKK